MTAWQLYFATLVGMAMHPGYSREGMHRPTLEECAEMADRMVRLDADEELPPEHRA